MPIYYRGKEIGNALITYSGGGGGGVTSETVACDYASETALDFYRTKSGTPLYAELTSDAETAIVYGSVSYWIKSGFLFWKENGELDADTSYYMVNEDGMDYQTKVSVSSIALADPPSYSTLYGEQGTAAFLPNTGDNPVQYQIKLVYG